MVAFVVLDLVSSVRAKRVDRMKI